MGHTKNHYKKLIVAKLKELYKDQYAAGKITDKMLDHAVEEVKKELDAAEPTKEKLGEAFEKFCSEQKKLNPNISPESLAYDDESREIFGDRNKYDQYKENRNELLKSCLKGIKREIAWDKIVKDLELKKENGSSVGKLSIRWKEFLIKDDSSDASKNYNIRLYELLALGSQLIPKEKFIELRTTQYANELNCDRVEAEKKAIYESEHVGDCILEMVEQKLEELKEKLNKAPRYSTYILKGEAGKEGFPGLEECHTVVDDEDVVLFWDLQKITNDIKHFGGVDSQKIQDKEKYAQNNQRLAKRISESVKQAELASNFYFSMLDPYKLIDRSEMLVLQAEDKKTEDAAARNAFSQECVGFCSNIGAMIGDAETHLGLQTGDDMEVFSDKKPILRVIRHGIEMKGKGELCLAIVRMQKLTDDGPMVAEALSDPQELFNNGYSETVNKFKDVCKDWSDKKHTSEKFENMRKALFGLKQAELSNNPSAQEYKAFTSKLVNLAEACTAYYMYKCEQRHGEHFRKGFETQRVKFAKDLREFAVKKMKELKYVKQHIDTVKFAAEKEAELANDAGYQKAKKAGSAESALDYLRQIDDAEKVRKRKQQKKEEARPKEIKNREKKLIQEEKNREERKKLFSDIMKIKTGCTWQSKNHQLAEETVDDYIKVTKLQRENLVAGDEKADQARHLMAGRIIKHLLEDENNALKKNPNADGTVHVLVNGGKLKDLADLLIQRKEFKEYFEKTRLFMENNYNLVLYGTECVGKTCLSFGPQLTKAMEEAGMDMDIEIPREIRTKKKIIRKQQFKVKIIKQEMKNEEVKEVQKKEAVEELKENPIKNTSSERTHVSYNELLNKKNKENNQEMSSINSKMENKPENDQNFNKTTELKKKIYNINSL